MKSQLAVASVSLFLLGVLWGSDHKVLVTTCVLGDVLSGEVTNVRSREPSRTQYVFRSDDGCSILVTANRFPEIEAGYKVRVEGEIEPISEFPVEYTGYADYLNRQGIDGTVRFATITVLDNQPTQLAVLQRIVRHQISSVFLDPEASVVRAMMLADRGGISDELTELFRSVGVGHILAISGLHISIVAGLLLIGLYRVPINPWMRGLFVIGMLWLFVLLVGAPLSAVRASFFWTIGLLAFQMRALVSLWTVYVMTAVGFISVSPSVLHDVGFQLSFLAVGGIGLSLFFVKARKTWQQVVLVSAGAFIATLPIISYHFGIVSVLGILANVIIVPTTSLFLTVATVVLLASFFFPTVALLGSVIVRILFQFMVWAATIVERLPYSVIHYTTPGWVATSWYVILAVLLLWLLRLQKRRPQEFWV